MEGYRLVAARERVAVGGGGLDDRGRRRALGCLGRQPLGLLLLPLLRVLQRRLRLHRRALVVGRWERRTGRRHSGLGRRRVVAQDHWRGQEEHVLGLQIGVDDSALTVEEVEPSEDLGHSAQMRNQSSPVV